MNTIHCAIYSRVSVNDEAVQTQEYNTLDNQEDSCKAYILSQKSQGWRMFDIYRDPGKSGGSLNRPALQRLLGDIRAGKIHKIVVYKIDRLTRSINDFLKLCEDFEKYGVQFASTTQQIDTGTSSGRLLLRILLEFSQFEREMVQERTRDKRWGMAKMGMWTGGYIPIGYSNQDKKLVINPEEARIVKQLFELYSQLGNLSHVAAQLNRNGYKTKYRVAKNGKKLSGTRWDKKKVALVLANPVYIGKIRFIDPKTRKEYIFDGLHQPVITDMKLWEQTRVILGKNRDLRKSYKQNKYELLLSGLVKCGTCGTMMSNSSKGKNGKLYLYYKCTSVCETGKEACPVRTVSAAELDRAVVEALKQLGADDKILEKSIREADKLQREGIGTFGDERRRLTQKQSELKEQIRQTIALLKRLPDGTQFNTVVEELAGMEKSAAEMREEFLRVQTNIDIMERQSIDAETYKRLFRQFGEMYAELNFEEQRSLIMLLVREVLYTPRQMTIKFWGDLKDIDLRAMKKSSQTEKGVQPVFVWECKPTPRAGLEPAT